MFATTRQLQRRLGALLGVALAAGLLAVTVVSTPRTTSERVAPVSCIGYCAYPRNAGEVFGWGREAWGDEYEGGPFPRRNWRSAHPARVGQYDGMMTIQAGPSVRRTLVTRHGHAARYGRWEARLRAVEFNDAGRHFAFTWKLVSARHPRCGPSIVLAHYRPGDHAVRGSVRTEPGDAFRFALGRDLRSRAWHAYGVEVTSKRISWFVDTQVVRTERRPAALAGVRLQPQLVVEGDPGVRHRRSAMQVDWVRHHTLAKANKRPVQAPPMRRGTHDDC